MMKRILLTALLIGIAALPAQAACYADYKAKQDNPLKLHYGVVQVSDSACASGAAAAEVAAKIGRDGWILLNVLSVFGPEGLDQRRESAGAYYLRY